MSQTLSATEQLCKVNVWIELSFQRFVSSDQYILDLATLRTHLKVTADCVRIAASENSLESRQQMCLYRDNLVRLQKLLPTVQIRLRARRQRLGMALNSVGDLKAWTESNQISIGTTDSSSFPSRRQLISNNQTG